MIQELISTSAPRCLDGNVGFGIVAQTQGMSPNVSQAANALSGYTHIAAPGSAANPVIYLHAARQTGGMLLHIVSRIADCGNDYSGRSNRIAHHWIIEESDVRSLPGGPCELTAQNIFRSQWTEKPAVLPPKNLSSTDVPPKKCTAWEQMTGDAGWGGIVAERAEKGDPISIIFSPEHSGIHLRTLIGEALGLLPSSVRWRITFSTYSMKSHEAGGGKIQIKCFLAGSEESQFARQSPNTLVIDLWQRQEAAPAGKYVEWARGTVKPPPRSAVNGASSPSASEVHNALQRVAFKNTPMEEIYYAERLGIHHYAAAKNKNWKTYLSHGLLIFLVLGLGVGLWLKTSELATTQAKLATTQADRDQAQSTLETTRNNVERKCNELEGLQNELKDKTESLERKTKEYDDMKKPADQRERDYRDLKKQNDIAEHLSSLPTHWAGLGLYLGRESKESIPLPNSGNLGRYKNDVKVEYVPFVDLSKTVKPSITDAGKPEKHPHPINVDIKDSKFPVTFYLFCTFVDKEEEKDDNGEPKMDEEGNPVKKEVAKEGNVKISEIQLTDNGLQFIWEDAVKNRKTEEWYQIKNRILLSKLKISIGNNPPRMIALWTPPPKQLARGQTAPWVAMDEDSQYHAELTTIKTSKSTFRLPIGKQEVNDLDAATSSNLQYRTPTELIQTYLMKPDTADTSVDNLLLLRTK